ncbi:MAG: glycosyl hydrolase family 18 protein [Peptoniphilaceae bacterium]
MKKIIISLLSIIIILGGVLSIYYLNSRASGETSSKYKELSFISGDKDIAKEDFDRIDGQIYLSLDYIKENLDDTVYYDKNENIITFVNDSGTKRVEIGDNVDFAILNGKKIGLRDPIIKNNNKILVPIEIFIHDYPVKLSYDGDKKLIILDFINNEKAIGISTGNGLNIREKNSVKSPIVSILQDGDKVYVYGEKGDFYKVREINGYAGYIKKNLLEVKFPKNRFQNKIEEKKEAKKPLNLTWDYTYARQSDESIASIRDIEGLDVICPTWFSLKDGNGNLIDNGRVEYVNKYNNLGIDVWACLDNSFKADITHESLSSTRKREKIISQVFYLTKSYNLKGINVDFEQTNIEDRDLITQFVRELSGVFKSNDLKVSVAVTPIISQNVKNEPYDRESLAEICDYIMIMAYDQHWASSDVAGSVAEYKWVEGNINNMLRIVPREKLVLGIPLYSRLWHEGEDKLNSNSISMNQVKKIIATNNIKPKWQEGIKQYYAEYKENGKNFKLWIEDVKSLEWKTSLVAKYNLAGVGSWRKGFETEDVWKMINEVLPK